MSPVLPLSERAERAKQLLDDALGSAECCARIDALVHSAATSLGVDIASLSMLTDRQTTLSAYGPAGASATTSVLERGAEAAFEDTICATALRIDEPLVIPDARHDARVSSVPAVQTGLIGSYLGSLLRREGDGVGVLCVASAQRRDWKPTDSAVLDRIAGDILLELVRHSSNVRFR